MSIAAGQIILQFRPSMFLYPYIILGFTLNTAPHTETKSVFLVASVAMMVANTGTCTFLIAGRIW